jgi:hypothetical protein
LTSRSNSATTSSGENGGRRSHTGRHAAADRIAVLPRLDHLERHEALDVGAELGEELGRRVRAIRLERAIAKQIRLCLLAALVRDR